MPSKPRAEGRTYQVESLKAIETSVLQTLPYQGARQLVRIETDEFSAVCPFSGLPDYGRVSVLYVPRKRLVELKSLKYYIVSFRNVGIYQEDATNRIFNDLKRLLKPVYLKVETAYKTRGGLDTTCVMEEGRP